jgi:ubiquinone/menaquinone biosynthesis C-methylase UbiE
MPEELSFKDEAAAEYDRAFAHVTAYFMPFLLRAAHLAPGMRVLDIATGTGLSAEAALVAVGPTGHVAAADHLGGHGQEGPRASRQGAECFGLGGGRTGAFLLGREFRCGAVQSRTDVLPDPVRGLSEFRRVLRRSGRAAVSVNTVVERSYNHQINVMIARYLPSLAEAVTRTFALGEASQLQLLFNEAGFADFETDSVRHTFVLPSFDAYYGPFERGGGSTGQALATLPQEIRSAIREEVRRDLADTGGPIEAEAEYRIASGRR